jgi:hypothetical protein
LRRFVEVQRRRPAVDRGGVVIGDKDVQLVTAVPDAGVLNRAGDSATARSGARTA